MLPPFRGYVLEEGGDCTEVVECELGHLWRSALELDGRSLTVEGYWDDRPRVSVTFGLMDCSMAIAVELEAYFCDGVDF